MATPGTDGRTCPACGERVDPREGRAYDKDATPWSLRGAPSEQFCRTCFGALDTAPRDGLEARLVEIDAGRCDRATFLRRYLAAERPDRS